MVGAGVGVEVESRLTGLNPGASWQSPHPLQPLHVRNNKLGAQISKFGQIVAIPDPIRSSEK